MSSAKWVDATVSRHGAIRVQIDHDDITGVTPEMLQWWFENLGGTIHPILHLAAHSAGWRGPDLSPECATPSVAVHDASSCRASCAGVPAA
ncbi:MAG: hypothetical protein R2720_07255 [Candidatus Nanopelagicales bacterium]